MGCNIGCKLIKWIESFQGFAVQIDGATGLPVLLTVEDQLSMCKHLPTY
jgi:hypothetical protein